MEKQRRRDVRGIVGKIAAVVFAAGFVLSIVPAIRALAEGTIFKIQSVEITEISAGATGNINTYNEQNIVSNVTFHKINDSVSYKIILKNSDTKDYVIESITDDNTSEQISYAYDAHVGETIAAGADLDFLLTAKYTTPVTDMTKRAMASNVKFFIKFAEKEEPEEIDIVVPDTDAETPVVPNTGANTKDSKGAGISLATMIISVVGLTVLALIAVKKHKKYAKIIGVAVVAVSAFGLVTSARAANIETNSFTLTTSYGLYDKLVIKNGDKDVIIDYGEKLENVDEITEPTKPGYTFNGWEDENGNPVDPTKPITEDITIKPKFVANAYTVKFDANGGNGTMAEMQFTYDEAQALTANAFSFTGREYTGWDTKVNGSGVHYDDEAEVKNLTTENDGVVTLYAQWSTNPFHIEYDGNDATSGEMATTNCEYDEACELRDNAFEKYGYDFAGWKYNDTIYADKADVTNIIDHGTITMQAQWTPHVYTIIYTGLTNEEATALRTAGNPDNYTIETTSFTLIKPADRKDADGDVRERCIGWRDVTVYEDVTLPISNALGDKTYEAVWQTVALEEFDITYDYDGGNVVTANPTKLNKEQGATLNEPVKTGYTFTGWTGTTISGDTPVKPYTIPAPHQKGDLEYTAHYRAHTYTVNFDINTNDTNVSGTMQPLVINYDEEKPLTANAFARTGYTFAGWKLGDDEYTDGQTVKNLTAEDGATVILKAQWTPTEYTIIFHANNDNVENPDVMTPQVITYDVDTELNASQYTWYQHKIVEWTTNANGTGAKYADKAIIKNLDANGGEIHLYAKWREIDAALDGRGSMTNKGINTKLKAITTANPDAKNFLHYPNGEPSDEIKASATDLSGTIDPIYAWVDGENIYWWSEDVKPRISTNNSVEYHYYGVGKSTAEGNVNNLEYMDLTGFDTTGIVGARSPFEYTNIRRVDISDWDLSNATDMSYFAYASKLEDIIFPEHFDIQKVTSLNMAFAGAKLKKLDFRGWKTRDLRYLTNFIQSMPTITEVTFGGDFKTDNVTSMASMINANANLATINNINTLNTAKVTSMRGMFDSDTAITSLDLSAFDTTALTDMAGMFKNMSGLTSLTLKGSFTAANVTNMEGTFYGVKNISTFDLSNLVSKPTNLKQTFAFTGGGAIETIDISNMDLSDVTTVEWTFFNANSGLKTIYTSNSVKPEVVTNNAATFQYDTGLVGGANTHTYEVGGISSGAGSRIDDPDNGKPGYFTIKGARYIRYHDNDDDDTNDEANYALMKSYYLKAGDSLKKNAFVRDGYVFTGWKDADGNEYTDEQVMADLTESKTPLELYAQWKELTAMLNTGSNINTALKNINENAIAFTHYTAGTPDFGVIDGEQDIALTTSNFPVYAWNDSGTVYWWSEAEAVYMNTDSSYMFQNLASITDIELDGLDSINVNDMSFMFDGCASIEEIDITPLNTTNVTNMHAMFAHMTNLSSLDVSSLEMGNVENVQSFAAYGSHLTELDLSSWDTSNFKNINWIVNESAVKKLNLSGWNTDKVENFTGFNSFFGSVEELDLSNWTNMNFTDMSNWFKGASNFKKINFTNFNTSEVINMASMFNEATGLTTLDLSSFNTSKVNDMSLMFRNDTFSTLNISNFDTASLENMYGMFAGLRNIEKLDLSMFNTSNVTNMRSVFNKSTIKELDLSSWDTGRVENMWMMFEECSLLERVYVGDLWTTSSVTNSNAIFNKTSKLVGGSGTVWNSGMTHDLSYARIDDPDNVGPGLFTLKNARYIRYHYNDGDDTNDEANYGLMTSHYLKAGDSLTKNAFVRGGYVFTGWKDADNNEYTDEQVMTSLTESKTPLELYAQWDAAPYTVTFNANGGEVLQSAKTVTYLQPYGELPTPVRYDYTTDPSGSILGSKYGFKEWNTKADGSGDTITPSLIYTNTDDTTLYAIWNDQFTVTIYNGESETPTTASYGVGDIVYLNAQNVAGKQFLYWEVDGAKKAYTKDYSMRMFQGKDLTIRAIYGSESDLESQQPGTYISDIYRQYSNNKVFVRSYSYVPDGYQIVKAGVVATLDANIANGTFDDQTATYPRAASVNGSSDNYYYTWSKSNVTLGQTVYAKAYLIYKDADGIEHTIYGDLVTATLTE